jgi:ABC-type transport system substrate-binding protein
MDSNYWTRITQQRLTRRRALVLTGATAAGAAFLAACGGSDSSSGGGSSDAKKEAANDKLYKPVNETKSAKRGGTLIGVQQNGIATAIDPMAIGAHGVIGQRVYSQLFRLNDGELKNTDGSVAGDLFSSWELSPDKLTLTGKIDPGAGLPPLPPVNGRNIDADDVLFSWERFKKQANQRGDISNEVNPAAPVVSVTAPDKQTIVMKLAEPNVTLFTLLGHSGLGYLYIMPKEAGDTAVYDVKNTGLASGPYYVTSFKDTELRFKRNPNFKRQALKDNEPYIDEIYDPIIPDNAQVLAQFRTGAIYEAGISPDQVLGVKADAPLLNMYAMDPTTNERIYFGQLPDSPFKDERVRIAYFKTIDRDAYITAAHNTDGFEKAGLPVQTWWESSFHQSSWSGYILDPKSMAKEYGDKANNFKFDIAEAKKLIEAAGLKTPLEYDQIISKPGPTSFAPITYKRTEIFMGMVENSGIFKIKPGGRTQLEWAVEWVPKIRNIRGQFNGTSWGPDTAPADPALAAFFVYNQKGGYFEGGDATLDDLTGKIRREFDQAKRQDLVKELQKYDAGKFYNQKVGIAGGFGLSWPVLRNAYVYRGGTSWQAARASTGPRTFIDPNYAPLKKS